MSVNLSENLPSDGHIAVSSEHGDTVQLQGHRNQSTAAFLGKKTAVTMDEANEPEVENMETQISAGQKMLSAVSGSLLTSLLGNIVSASTSSESTLLTI